VEREQYTGGVLSQRSESESRSRRQDWWLIQRLNGRIGRDQLALSGRLNGSSGSGRFETRSATNPSLENSQTQRQSWQLSGDWTRRLPIGKLDTTLAGSGQDDGQERQGLVNFKEDRQESTWQLKSKLTGARESLLWMAGIEYETRSGKGQSQLGTGAAEQLSSGIDRTALWGQNEWALPYKTTLTLGLRAESVQLRSAVDAHPHARRRERAVAAELGAPDAPAHGLGHLGPQRAQPRHQQHQQPGHPGQPELAARNHPNL
jgi:hypothetical protein